MTSSYDHEWATDDLRTMWVERSKRLGEIAQPHIERMLDVLADGAVATLTTSDGFNICSVGLQEDTVGRFAALSSSLHSVAVASMAAVPNQQRDVVLDTLSVQAGELLLVHVLLENEKLGKLVFAVVAKLPLGVLRMEATRTANAIGRALDKAL